MNELQLDYLANQPDVLLTIAHWYEDEWGYLREYSGAPPYLSRLPEYLNTAKIPLMIVALQDSAAVGVAQLKIREMDIFPQYEHWLGGVYVTKPYRGRNIASSIVKRIIQEAKKLNVSDLYLQTEQLDGGLYSKLGWQPMKIVDYQGREVLVMSRKIC